MFKFLFFVYVTLFVTYVLFTRQPDFFDGEITTGKVTKINNQTTIQYYIGATSYTIKANYPLQWLNNNQTVQVMYEASNPLKAKRYYWWGYWILWEELLASIIGWILLYQVAVGINKNPTPEALLEQLEYKPSKKTKYDL